MNTNKTVVWLLLASLMTYMAGCGKTESPAPSAPVAEPQKAPEPKPIVSAAQPTQPTSQKVALDGATVPVAPVAKLAGSAPPLPPTNAPKAPDTSNPGPTTPAAAPGQTPPTLASLSQDQVVRGLQEALGKGLQQAILRLGHDGGFLTNLSVRIPMPEKLQKIESALRTMKQDKLADDFVATMNHAAEQAVPEAGTVFADALKRMSIQDAKSILTGPNDAATQYFQHTTQTNLYARFYPIVQQATQKTGVTAAYKKLMEKANLVDLSQVTQKLGSFGSSLDQALPDKQSMDLDAYVTTKALDGLFKMVADEEQQIRQNPVARTTDLLQKVFGALKK